MSEERERTRVTISPKKNIFFDPKFQKSEKIVIRNMYKVPLEYKFQSTGREFFRVDSSSGMVNAQEEISITVTFKTDEEIIQKHIESGKTETKKYIRIRLSSRDKSIQIQKQLRVNINFLPKEEEGGGGIDESSPLDSDDGATKSEYFDSAMFQSIIEDKNVKKMKTVLDEEGERKKKRKPEDQKRRDEEKKEDEEGGGRRVIKNGEKSKNEHLSEERDAKLAFELRKKKILQSLFRFFPCYFGCLVILLVNHHVGFAWISLKITFASFFIGFAVAYVQFELLKQEKKIK